MLRAVMGVLRCPRCDASMAAALVDDVEVDFCEGHGIWLDGGEIEVLSARHGGTPTRVETTAPPPRRPLPDHPFCPCCDRPLAPARIPGAWLALDACAHGHGVWLDHGELEQAFLLVTQ